MKASLPVASKFLWSVVCLALLVPAFGYAEELEDPANVTAIQPSLSSAEQTTAATDVAMSGVSSTTETGLSRNEIAAIISGSTVAGVMGLTATAWWWGKPLHTPRWRDTGAFSSRTYAGGSDKLGHTFALYLMTVELHKIYADWGVTGPTALWWSAGSIFMIGNGIELFDSMTDFGFEYGDVVANTVGIAIGTLANYSPDFHDSFGLRMAWWPSELYLTGGTGRLGLLTDYPGMIFYADLRGRGLARLAGLRASVLDYLLAGVNWATYDYSSKLSGQDLDKRRELGIHIGISASEVLADLLPDGYVRRWVTAFTRYVSPPFTTVDYVRDLDSDRTYFRFGVNGRFLFGR